MDQRRNDVAEWMVHLPSLSHTPVQQRKENRKMSNANEAMKMGEEKSKPHSLDPHMVEAMRIYRSEFWESTNISWLFNREPPEWLDTDPADWSGVKMILQDFKYKDVQRRLARDKPEIETTQTEFSDSDSDSSDSNDYPTVRIVGLLSTEKNLKSCLKTGAYLRTNIIKMVIFGSIDIELYSLDEDEIEWKNIPVSLERFDVNDRYIRDISLEEMRVRKLSEVGMDLYTDKDKGDSMVAGASRVQLCDFYNKKLQSQIAECTMERPAKGLKYKLPVRQELSEVSGQRAETLLFENSVTRMIARRKFPKQVINNPKHLHQTKFNHVLPTTAELESKRGDRCRDVIAHGCTSVSDTGSTSVKHSADNENMASQRRGSCCGEPLTPASSLSDIVDFSGISTDDLLEDAISEYPKKTDVKEIYKLKSSATTVRLQKKRSLNGENTKPNLSGSQQSLDELLDDALESQAELERRRVKLFSRTSSNSDNQQAEMDYASLHGLNKFDKRDDNPNWKPAIDVFDSEVDINNVCSDAPLTQESLHHKNKSESFRHGGKSPRDYLEQRKFRAGNSEVYTLPPSRSLSNASTFSELSMEDWNDPRPSQSDKRAGPERSSSEIKNCDNTQTHSVEFHVHHGRRKFLCFINRNVSSFWKKLKSFNCCSNSL